MPTLEKLPSDPGTYILFLLLSKFETIAVGSLGSSDFPPGYYAYTGSAQGPGGLKGRIGRHLRPSDKKRPHWHIDHLTSQAKITHVCWEEGKSNLECSWALGLEQLGSIPVPHFGSSDCGCPGHLIWLPTVDGQPHDWNMINGILGANVKSVRITSQ